MRERRFGREFNGFFNQRFGFGGLALDAQGVGQARVGVGEFLVAVDGLAVTIDGGDAIVAGAGPEISVSEIIIDAGVVGPGLDRRLVLGDRFIIFFQFIQRVGMAAARVGGRRVLLSDGFVLAFGGGVVPQVMVGVGQPQSRIGRRRIKR